MPIETLALSLTGIAVMGIALALPILRVCSWWDGTYWNAANGSWGWFGETASFEDEPGFNAVSLRDYSLYWGGVGRKGYFQFETHVCDGSTYRTIRKLS